MELFLIVISAVCLSIPVRALARNYGGEEMISVASGYRQSLFQAPSIITEITSTDIRNMGATPPRSGAGISGGRTHRRAKAEEQSLTTYPMNADAFLRQGDCQ